MRDKQVSLAASSSVSKKKRVQSHCCVAIMILIIFNSVDFPCLMFVMNGSVAWGMGTLTYKNNQYYRSLVIDVLYTIWASNYEHYIIFCLFMNQVSNEWCLWFELCYNDCEVPMNTFRYYFYLEFLWPLIYRKYLQILN